MSKEPCMRCHGMNSHLCPDCRAIYPHLAEHVIPGFDYEERLKEAEAAKEVVVQVNQDTEDGAWITDQRPCPGCGFNRHIPDDDYVCAGCRSTY